MKLPKNKSLNEFYQLNKMYSSNNSLNEGFFGELFAGILKAFASLFGIEIKEISNSTYKSSNSSFGSKIKEYASKGDIEVPKDKKPEDVDLKGLDQETVKKIVGDVVAEKIEGAYDAEDVIKYDSQLYHLGLRFYWPTTLAEFVFGLKYSWEFIQPKTSGLPSDAIDTTFDDNSLTLSAGISW